MIQPGLIRVGSSANTLVSISQVLSSKQKENMHKSVLSPRVEEILKYLTQVEVLLICLNIFCVPVNILVLRLRKCTKSVHQK